MKFYVASSLENTENAIYIMKELKGRGHEITFDWSKYDINNNLPKNIKEALQRDLSDRCIQGVEDADIVILLLPGKRGAYSEFGMSMCSKKIVMVVGTEEKSSSFIHSRRVNFRFEKIEDFLIFVDEWTSKF